MNEKELADLYYFLKWAMKNNVPGPIVLATLAHDIIGLYHREECFLPRSSGYREKFLESSFNLN